MIAGELNDGSESPEMVVAGVFICLGMVEIRLLSPVEMDVCVFFFFYLSGWN